MGKPGGGGSGGGNVLFTTVFTGPPPGNATTGADQWIALATIPTGKRFWLGTAQFTSPDKSISFEIYSNNAGQSAGNLAACALLYKAAVSPRSGTLSVDMYKNGRLHTVSKYGTGVEKLWLRLFSKSGTQASYLYYINCTEE